MIANRGRSSSDATAPALPAISAHWAFSTGNNRAYHQETACKTNMRPKSSPMLRPTKRAARLPSSSRLRSARAAIIWVTSLRVESTKAGGVSLILQNAPMLEQPGHSASTTLSRPRAAPPRGPSSLVGSARTECPQPDVRSVEADQRRFQLIQCYR